MDLEDAIYGNPIKKESWRTVLTLEYQSLGVVNGDLSTSPLYVYKSTFAEDIKHSETNEEIYEVLSFVVWTLNIDPTPPSMCSSCSRRMTLVRGDFCSILKLRRHAHVSFLPNCQVADEEISAYKKDGDGIPQPDNWEVGSRVKSALEKYRVLQRVLLVLALIGTCMGIGDGVLISAMR